MRFKFLGWCVALAACASAAPKHEEPKLGLRFVLPQGWHRRDMSGGPVQVVVFSPSPSSIDTRLSVLRYPSGALPKGLLTREAQIKTLTRDYTRVELGEASLAGRAWTRLEYSHGEHRVIEHGIEFDKAYTIVQVASTRADWSKYDSALRGILDSLELFEPVRRAPPPAPRPLRDDVTILRHSIDLTIEPESRSLSSRDRMEVSAVRDDVREAEFWLSPIESARAADDEGPLQASLRDGKIVVALRRALKKGERLNLTVESRTSRFGARDEDSPVPGYVVLGQVSPDSSYTSHVHYYPVDRENRAPAELRITVPRDRVVAASGTPVRVERGETTATWIWKCEDGFPKALPYAWAVARYEKLEDRTASGVPVELYVPAERKASGQARLAVMKEVVEYFERVFGPFPFPRVAIAHVRPERGVAGVSLPGGLILLSDDFFTGEISYTDPARAFESALAVVDEISHQYNFYAVGFPNEFAEGFATFTDALFAEHKAGAGVRRAYFDYFFESYRTSIQGAPDAPILSPAVYRTDAYMGIAFCKGACVLQLLRDQVGDAAFFEALRRTFTDLRGKTATVDDFRSIVESSSKTDLGWFFDQWYRRSGYPRLQIAWKQERERIIVSVRQTQGGTPFRLPLTLVFESEGAPVEKTFPVSEARHEFEFSSAANVRGVRAAADRPLPATLEWPR